jgi:hypothetical protein
MIPCSGLVIIFNGSGMKRLWDESDASVAASVSVEDVKMDPITCDHIPGQQQVCTHALAY